MIKQFGRDYRVSVLKVIKNMKEGIKIIQK